MISMYFFLTFYHDSRQCFWGDLFYLSNLENADNFPWKSQIFLLYMGRGFMFVLKNDAVKLLTNIKAVYSLW